MAIFNSYVKLPEGTFWSINWVTLKNLKITNFCWWKLKSSNPDDGRVVMSIWTVMILIHPCRFGSLGEFHGWYGLR